MTTSLNIDHLNTRVYPKIRGRAESDVVGVVGTEVVVEGVTYGTTGASVNSKYLNNPNTKIIEIEKHVNFINI